MKNFNEFFKTHGVSVCLIIVAISILLSAFILTSAILEAASTIGTSIFMS